MGLGYLTIKTNLANDAVPLEGVQVTIQDPSGRTLYSFITDASGKTPPAALHAPDKIYTLDPDYTGATYSTYRVIVSHPGFVTEIVDGVQIFDTITAEENVDMHPLVAGGEAVNHIVIPPHEQVLRTTPRNQPGPTEDTDVPTAVPVVARALNRVIIPEFITVHLGRYNVAARNVRVPFPLYIKNVTSTGLIKYHSLNQNI